MRILAVFLSLLNLTFAYQASAASCEISTAKDRLGNPRIFKIQFPDGRKLSVVGQHHTDRNHMWSMLDLTADKNLFPKVREALSTPNSVEALPHLEDERALLRQAVKDGAQFIGVEMADERVGSWLVRNRVFQDRLLRHSARTGESDVELVSKARIAAYGAPLAMPLEEPALFLKAPLFGFENRELAIEHGEAWDALERVISEAKVEMGKDKVWNDKFDSFHREMLLAQYPVYDPDMPKEEFIRPLLSQWPGAYRKAIRKVLEIYRANFDFMYLRDNKSAENIVNKNKSGIVFIGAAHAQPIMLRLRETCLKQQLHGEDLTSAIPASTHR